MSSDFRKALLALTVVVVGGAALDYHLGGPNDRTGAAGVNDVVAPAQAADSAATAAQRRGDTPFGPPQATQGTHAARAAQLRVCEDPNNLPYSNREGQGFENALARLIAHDLGLTVYYTWWPQRRGFVRHTLNAGLCDVVMGVPQADRQVATTMPYYRSTYVFVTRRDRNLDIRSFDDPRLRTLKIGTTFVGDVDTPVASALVARGIIRNVRGYSAFGDYSKPNPPRALIDAVARGQIDVAIAWGPLAGYFAQHEPVALRIEPAQVPADAPPLQRMTFAISMGVRQDDRRLRLELDRVLVERRADIRRLLASYGVPLVSRPAHGAQE